MTGSHIDTVRHRRPLRRQPRRARRPGGRRDARAARRRHRATRSPSPSSPTRRAPASRPTCSAASCTSAGMAARGGARRRAPSTTAPGSATSWPASATPGRCRARRPRPPHAYVELHIEQGPILEDEGVTIGVVEGVQGISWTELTITGRSAHAGTTPMRMRRDAGYVAAAHHRRSSADLAARARRRPGRHRRPLRGAARPRQRRARRGATLTVDLRNTDERRAAARPSAALAAEVDAARRRRGRDGRRPRSLARFEPVEFDPATIDLVEATAAAPRPLDAADAERAPATTPRCWPGSARRR